MARKERDRIIESAAKIQQPKDDKQLKSLQTEVAETKKAISELKESFVKQPIPKTNSYRSRTSNTKENRGSRNPRKHTSKRCA